MKIDLVAPVVGLLNFRYRNVFSFSVEHSTFRDQSIQLTALYGENFVDKDFTNNSIVYNVHIKNLGRTIQIFSQYRFYTTLKRKLYFGPYLTYSVSHQHGKHRDNITNEEWEWNYTQQDAGVGGLMGYQFFIKKRISVDISLGLARLGVISKVEKGEHIVPIATDGIVALNIGYRFLHK